MCAAECAGLRATTVAAGRKFLLAFRRRLALIGNDGRAASATGIVIPPAVAPGGNFRPRGESILQRAVRA